PQPSALFREVIATRAELLGEAHELTADALHDAGRYALQEYHWEEARAYTARALAARRRLLGEHPDVARSLSNLGLALRNLGNPRDAEAHHRAALDLAVRTVSEADPLVSIVLGQLQADYRRLGEGEKERAASRKLYELSKKSDGPGSADAIREGIAMAEAFRRTGKATA